MLLRQFGAGIEILSGREDFLSNPHTPRINISINISDLLKWNATEGKTRYS